MVGFTHGNLLGRTGGDPEVVLFTWTPEGGSFVHGVEEPQGWIFGVRAVAGTSTFSTGTGIYLLHLDKFSSQ